MNNSVFRESSVDRLRSPEQLNEYIRVARPGVWLILSAIILLLVGVIVWSIFGTVVTTIQTGVLVSEDGTVCFVKAEDASMLNEGMTVTIAGNITGTLKSISQEPMLAEEDTYILQISDIYAGDYFLEVAVEVEGLEEGIYIGKIIVETIRPITFVTQ